MDYKNNLFLDSSIELTRTDVADLKIGMYVSELDCPWIESTFLFQGFELTSQADVKAVQDQCAFVYVDVLKSKIQAKVEKKVPIKKAPFSKNWFKSTTPPARKACFKTEINNATKAHQETSSLIKSFMDEVSLGGSINVQAAKDAVAQCVQSIMNSPDALMWMTQLKNKDAYTAEHSMNVCVLAIALGRHLNLPEEELHHLGLCGMMHDMGKMQIDPEVLNKSTKLNAHDVQMLKTHPSLGWQVLMKSSDMYSGAIDVAYAHHEKLDGSGYPRGLTSEQITPYTRIISIADIYDALTSDRVYRKGRTHLEAINHLTKIGESHLDLNLTIKFIECLGIYPPGSLVEMQNGEVAIVIEVNPSNKIKPKVIFLLDEDKQPQAERLEDLSVGRHHYIKGMVKAQDYNVDINKLYRDNLLDKSFAHV